ncbi:MAG: Uma2 family endonuclease [Spirochaetales bacterium]
MSVVENGVVKLTYQDYCQLPDDGNRHEIIDGVHFMSPAPSTRHQSASRHIQFSLYRQIEENGRGSVFNAPSDLELSPTDVIQPDIIVVLSENRSIILPSRIRGVPDLVVEILSPSTSERDQGVKRSLYEQHGVPEYWVVDADEEVILQHRLRGDIYGEPVRCTEVISFAEATVDLKRVWSRL